MLLICVFVGLYAAMDLVCLVADAFGLSSRLAHLPRIRSFTGDGVMLVLVFEGLSIAHEAGPRAYYPLLWAALLVGATYVIFRVLLRPRAR